MFFCNRIIYFKDNLCLQAGIPVCKDICKLARKYDIEVKFYHSYFGENDRGLFTWTTESVDEMNKKFEQFLHDHEYQKLNEKIVGFTSEGSSHDDIWREINDH